DRDNDLATSARKRNDNASLALRHERTSVFDEVGKDLSEAQIMPENIKVARVLGLLLRLYLNIDRLAIASCFPRGSSDVGDEQVQLDARCVITRELGIEARCVRNISDEPVETAHIMLNHFHQARPRIFVLCQRQRLDGAAQ